MSRRFWREARGPIEHPTLVERSVTRRQRDTIRPTGGSADEASALQPEQLRTWMDEPVKPAPPSGNRASQPSMSKGHLSDRQLVLAAIRSHVITGLIYPLAVTGLAQVDLSSAGQRQPDGAGWRSRRLALIGQPFDGPEYFWGRPSATAPFPYNACASSGSNLGPTNPALLAAVQTRIDASASGRSRQHRAHPGGPGHCLRQRSRPAHQLGRGAVPGARVARARGLSADAVARRGSGIHGGPAVGHSG